MSLAAIIAAVLASVAIVWWLLHSAGWRMTLTIEDDGEDTWLVLRGGWKR